MWKICQVNSWVLFHYGFNQPLLLLISNSCYVILNVTVLYRLFSEFTAKTTISGFEQTSFRWSGPDCHNGVCQLPILSPPSPSLIHSAFFLHDSRNYKKLTNNILIVFFWMRPFSSAEESRGFFGCWKNAQMETKDNFHVTNHSEDDGENAFQELLFFSIFKNWISLFESETKVWV